MNIEKVKKYAKSKMSFDPTGHDFYHAERVAELALNMYESEVQSSTDEDKMIIQIAAYLHDTIDDKVVANEDESMKEVKRLLQVLDISSDVQNRIIYIIRYMSFSKNLSEHHVMPSTGQYVQDADRIDALGAIGIARAFAYGGHADDEIYSPQLKIVDLANKDQYRKHKTTTINHFYEKLLKLEFSMNTSIGKNIAHKRTMVMRKFLEQFMQEWEGKL